VVTNSRCVNLKLAACGFLFPRSTCICGAVFRKNGIILDGNLPASGLAVPAGLVGLQKTIFLARGGDAEKPVAGRIQVVEGTLRPGNPDFRQR